MIDSDNRELTYEELKAEHKLLFDAFGTIHSNAAATYPGPLQKASGDPFDYALCLKNGDRFRFQEATPIDKEWVKLDCLDNAFGYKFDRGVYVRVSEIAWVCDAPMGS